MTIKTLILEGDHIHDIASFYDEINRVFMAQETWQLGASLDALDDMLYGAYGAAGGKTPVLLIWRNMEKSRADLGLAATQAYYREKLARPEMFNSARARESLDALEAGTGPTYFEIVLEVFAGHPRVTLRAE
jgi:RNAse (barnase) inhibitor barstar